MEPHNGDSVESRKYKLKVQFSLTFYIAVVLLKPYQVIIIFSVLRMSTHLLELILYSPRFVLVILITPDNELLFDLHLCMDVSFFFFFLISKFCF